MRVVDIKNYDPRANLVNGDLYLLIARTGDQMTWYHYVVLWFLSTFLNIHPWMLLEAAEYLPCGNAYASKLDRPGHRQEGSHSQFITLVPVMGLTFANGEKIFLPRKCTGIVRVVQTSSHSQWTDSTWPPALEVRLYLHGKQAGQ